MIPLFKPSYGQEELDVLKEPFKTGWIGLGPKTKEFEDKFACYIGVPYSVGVNSCTAALHLSMKVANIEGSEVITTPMTFISTNHAILYNNAIPVFADIEEDTLNIDAEEVQRLVTPRTKAIVVLHYGGHSCEMDFLVSICRKHGLVLVEDCAHACGGEYKGKKLGSIGDYGCFSFHAVKNLATGEGGMITLKDENVDKRLRKLRWLGISKGTWDRAKSQAYSWEYDVEELGFKCHMHDISAALGLVQLAKLEKNNARRRKIVYMYNEGLKELKWLRIPVEKPYAKSAWHNYVIKVENGRRDELIEHLNKNEISAGVHYIPNHLYEMYRPYRRELPVAEKVWKKLVTLPLYPDLKDDEVGMIIDVIRKFER